MKKALICGISGQDGVYLAKFLLEKGYEVFGTSRNAESKTLHNLSKLGLHDDVCVKSVSLIDYDSVARLLETIRPHEIYNLAGQTSVARSFEKPIETFESITMGTLNILESIRCLSLSARLYSACSSECFGDTGSSAANEDTPFKPRSPYAVAKTATFWEVANFRESYNLFACSGILFNHESPLRPKHFVSQKIAKSVCEISQGKLDKLSLGNLSIRRDWGWAPEYVQAMWLMLQQDQPEDFVIATGNTASLEEFVVEAFNVVGLHWKDYVHFDSSFLRPTDIAVNRGNPTKARTKLGWQARFGMKDIVNKMVDAQLREPGYG